MTWSEYLLSQLFVGVFTRSNAKRLGHCWFKVPDQLHFLLTVLCRAPINHDLHIYIVEVWFPQQINFLAFSWLHFCTIYEEILQLMNKAKKQKESGQTRIQPKVQALIFPLRIISVAMGKTCFSLFMKFLNSPKIRQQKAGKKRARTMRWK